eukprot:s301_g10.t1
MQKGVAGVKQILEGMMDGLGLTNGQPLMLIDFLPTRQGVPANLQLIARIPDAMADGVCSGDPAIIRMFEDVQVKVKTWNDTFSGAATTACNSDVKIYVTKDFKFFLCNTSGNDLRFSLGELFGFGLGSFAEKLAGLRSLGFKIERLLGTDADMVASAGNDGKKEQESVAPPAPKKTKTTECVEEAGGDEEKKLAGSGGKPAMKRPANAKPEAARLAFEERKTKAEETLQSEAVASNSKQDAAAPAELMGAPAEISFEAEARDGEDGEEENGENDAEVECGDGAKNASIQSGNVVPVDMNRNSGFFSATFIRPLTNGYLVKAKVKQPFPQKEPTYPKLVEFHAVQPDYKAYCNPIVLQNPGAFQTSVEETNPCYHTFNAEVVKGVPATKGISEQAFWNCADRQAARNYMGAMTTSGREKTEYKTQETVDLLTDITLALQLVSGVAGMIPWGSYAAPGEKGAEKGGKAVEQKEKKVVEKEVKKEVETGLKKTEHELRIEEVKIQHQVLDKALAAQKAAQEAAKADSAMAVLGRFYNKHNKQFDSFVKTLKATGKTVAQIQKVRARKQKGATKEVEDKTIPNLDGPTYKQTSNMAKSTWNDCLPLQFGLSKVMCDLFCVQDSVREGTSAILSSLEASQRVLMENLQALLNYQTETVINKKPEASEATLLSGIPSPSGLLEELWHIDFEDAKATVPSVSRRLDAGNVLDWHRSTAPELYGRMAAMSVNATPQNWPKARQDWQMKDKLQLLRDDAVKHRRQAEQAQLLRFQMKLSPISATETIWTSILDSFLHCHEKHNTFTMMQLRALDQHDTALNLAQNFSDCKADTAELHETWQRAMHAEERSKETLLEAWSATVTTAERLAMAFEDRRVLTVGVKAWGRALRQAVQEEGFLSGVDFDHRPQANSYFNHLHLRESCHSISELAQKLYLEAVFHVDSTLKPFSMQLVIFNTLAKYQEHYLLNKRLDYIPLPTFVLPKSKLTAIADPTGHGTQLAIQALQAWGRELCPAPPSCPQGMLLPDVSAAVQQMDEVEQCNHGGRSSFVGVMTYDLAEALMQNVTLEPVGLTSVSLLELSELYS